MSSYSSQSSFLSDSTLSTSADSSKGSHFPSPEFALAQAAIPEEEALDHPLLSKHNKEVVVVDHQGFPVMQTKSAWQKQMDEKKKEDLKKEKKAARKARNSHHAPEPVSLMTKKEKKAKKDLGIVDEDA